jgi:hypothetical protein
MSDYKYASTNIPFTWSRKATGVGHPIEFPRCSHCGISAPHHYMRTAGRAYCFDCVAKAIELLVSAP